MEREKIGPPRLDVTFFPIGGRVEKGDLREASMTRRQKL